MHHKEYLGAENSQQLFFSSLQLEINSWKQELARLHTHKTKLVCLPDRTE